MQYKSPVLYGLTLLLHYRLLEPSTLKKVIDFLGGENLFLFRPVFRQISGPVGGDGIYAGMS